MPPDATATAQSRANQLFPLHQVRSIYEGHAGEPGSADVLGAGKQLPHVNAVRGGVSEIPAIRQAIGQRDNAGAGGPGAQRMVRNLAGSLFAGGVGVGPDDNVAPLEASPIRLAHRAAAAGPGQRNTIIE